MRDKPVGRQRDYGLDLTRAMAAVLVLAVHFFLNTGFYETPLQGGGMLLAAGVRMACMTCVPLFMLLTGYLCVQRRWSGRYYLGLLPVLLTYLLAGAVCQFYQLAIQGKELGAAEIAARFLNFGAVPYGWYIEMYVGLFLISPFLNAAWRAMGERERLAAVITLLAMTAAPTLTNLFGQVLPDWWAGIYPVTYYALGAWLREHPLRWKKRWLGLGFLALSAANGLFQAAVRRGGPMTYLPVSDWASLFVVGEALCLFCLLSGCDGSRTPGPVRWCVGRAARLSLPIYLISWVTDQIIYPPLQARVPEAAAQLPWILVMVPTSLLVSGVMAQLIDWAVRALMRLLPDRKDDEKAANAQCRGKRKLRIKV